MEKKKINIFKTWQILRLKKKNFSKMVLNSWKLKSLPVFLKKSISKMEILLKHAVGRPMKDQLIIKRAKSQRQRLNVKWDKMSLDWTIAALSAFHTNGNKSTKSWKKKKKKESLLQGININDMQAGGTI